MKYLKHLIRYFYCYFCLAVAILDFCLVRDSPRAYCLGCAMFTACAMMKYHEVARKRELDRLRRRGWRFDA